MGSKVEAKEGKIWVTKTMTRLGKQVGDSEDTDENIAVVPFETDPASVSFGCGATISIGKYESVRVDCRVSLPCYVEELEEVFGAAKTFAEKKLETEIETVRQFAQSRKHSF